LLGLILYVPLLSKPFRTFELPLIDWAIVVGLALTISPVLELVKWALRRGWFAEPLHQRAGSFDSTHKRADD
jgi:Ca2+-transporting ATPase